jgi:hypothetical protein
MDECIPLLLRFQAARDLFSGASWFKGVNIAQLQASSVSQHLLANLNLRIRPIEIGTQHQLFYPSIERNFKWNFKLFCHLLIDAY